MLLSINRTSTFLHNTKIIKIEKNYQTLCTQYKFTNIFNWTFITDLNHPKKKKKTTPSKRIEAKTSLQPNPCKRKKKKKKISKNLKSQKNNPPAASPSPLYYIHTHNTHTTSNSPAAAAAAAAALPAPIFPHFVAAAARCPLAFARIFSGAEVGMTRPPLGTPFRSRSLRRGESARERDRERASAEKIKCKDGRGGVGEAAESEREKYREKSWR